jgi:hypothetical protein
MTRHVWIENSQGVEHFVTDREFLGRTNCFGKLVIWECPKREFRSIQQLRHHLRRHFGIHGKTIKTMGWE